MKNRTYRILTILLALSLWLVGAVPLTIAPPARAQAGSTWAWMSPDLDGDGLLNATETGGWCNAVGCFHTDAADADSDDDGLSDGEEKLFDSDPSTDASPGIYVIYEASFKTGQYYPWQQYGHQLIARGDDFDPPNPDSIDAQKGHGTDLDAVVVRRGTTFYVGGPFDTTLQISKSKPSLTTLAKARDPYTGLWRVGVPADGTVGKYTLRLGGKSLDLFIIFELPTPYGELSQRGIQRFVYDDNPRSDLDDKSILLGDERYDYPYGFVAQGISYPFNNQQYNRFLLEDYVIDAINGRTSQKSAANALTDKADEETVFRNPRVSTSSWSVLNPGRDPRQQCSNIAGLLAAFNRAAGIPARPMMVDWRSGSFDHATEIWMDDEWRVYRGYKVLEMNQEPDDTPIGCSSSVWPACGSFKDYSRSKWGTSKYRPWHSGGSGSGNVIVLADDYWTSTGLAYRWPSWAVDTIKLNENRFMTQHTEYWRSFGWTQEPRNTGNPGWPPPPSGVSAAEATELSNMGTGFDVQSSQVQLGDVVGEYGVDSNGNGQYDQLVLEVEVTVTQPGDYWLLGQLGADHPEPRLTGTGGLIAQALTHVGLVEGRQVVQLIFSGTDISLKRVDGPYVLSGLWIADIEAPDLADFVNESLAYRGYLHTSAPYHAVDFETYGAMLSDSYSHYDLDSDGDGRPEVLVLTTGINIFQSGSYTVRAALYDNQDRFITHTTWTGAGPEVTLRFEDMAGTLGPYTVRDLELLDSEGQAIDYIAEAYALDPILGLASPKLASLDILPAGADQLIALGEAVIPSNVFKESLVDGNLRIEAEVEVSQAGTFRLEAWLADANGALVTWTQGEPASLAVGRKTLSLTFGGHAIRARGLPGPYKVVALKLLDGSAGYQVLDKVDIALTTQAYRLDQFAAGGRVIFQDFVENGGNRWVARAPWAISQENSFSPSHAWYGTDANASLTLASPLDLSDEDLVAIRFQTAYQLGSDGDTGYVQVSTNRANWRTLAVFSDDVSWSTYVLDLSDYAGEKSVYLRFRLESAGGGTDDGWYIDDVLVAGIVDSDGDGLSDEDEKYVYGTNPNKADTDGDGLSDGDEVNVYGTNPRRQDTDRDGLSDGDEVKVHGTNPVKADSDGDGLSDGDEIRTYATNPNAWDTDEDGLSDGDEVKVHGTNPRRPDTDWDGLSDGDEVNVYGTNPKNPDSDGDGLSDADEVNVYGTNPTNSDSDGDRLPDAWEVNHGLNPLDGSDADDDPDDDGLTNWEEYQKHTDPRDPDTDDDGLTDREDPFPLPALRFPLIAK